MNVKLKIGQLLEKRKTSILTLGNGIALQFLIAFVLSFFLMMLKDNAIGMIVITSISFIWYFIPLIGFFGCYAGINYMRKYGVDYFNFN